MVPSPPLSDVSRHLVEAVLALHDHVLKERGRMHPDDEAELGAIAAAVTELHGRVSQLSQRMRRREKE